MNGPLTLLLLVLAVVPVFLLLLRLDAWLTERAYQRQIRGDETARYERARQAVARAQHPSVRIGHHHNKNTGNHHD